MSLSYNHGITSLSVMNISANIIATNKIDVSTESIGATVITSTTSAFVQPERGGAVVASMASTTDLVAGNTIIIQSGGYYIVTSIIDTVTASLTCAVAIGAAPANTIVAADSLVLRVAANMQGAYSGSATYVAFDAIMYAGAMYFATDAMVSGTNPASTDGAVSASVVMKDVFSDGSSQSLNFLQPVRNLGGVGTGTWVESFGSGHEGAFGSTGALLVSGAGYVNDPFGSNTEAYILDSADFTLDAVYSALPAPANAEVIFEWNDGSGNFGGLAVTGTGWIQRNTSAATVASGVFSVALAASQILRVAHTTTGLSIYVNGSSAASPSLAAGATFTGAIGIGFPGDNGGNHLSGITVYNTSALGATGTSFNSTNHWSLFAPATLGTQIMPYDISFNTDVAISTTQVNNYIQYLSIDDASRTAQLPLISNAVDGDIYRVIVNGSGSGGSTTATLAQNGAESGNTLIANGKPPAASVSVPLGVLITLQLHSGLWHVLTELASTFTVTTSDFTQPAANSTVAITVASTSWMATNETVYVASGGYYTVTSIDSGTGVTLTNLDYSGNATVSATVAATSLVTPSGVRGATGEQGVQGIQGIQGIQGDTAPLIRPVMTSLAGVIPDGSGNAVQFASITVPFACTISGLSGTLGTTGASNVNVVVYTGGVSTGTAIIVLAGNTFSNIADTTGLGYAVTASQVLTISTWADASGTAANLVAIITFTAS